MGESQTAKRPLRPRELQDALNFHLFHPLAWRLARALSRTPVTPNAVSILGGLFVVAAAIAYSRPGWPLPALAGLLLHMTWHVVDGADGDLARMTGRSGPRGELVDGICDYASHVVLYVVLAVVLDGQIGWIAWPIAVAAGASHIVQSNHFEVQRRQYQWWVYGTPWLRNARKADVPDDAPGRSPLASAYLRLADRIAPGGGTIDAVLASAAGDPARLDRLRGGIRQRWLELPASFEMLSSNHRTIMLGISMIAGSPVYYFIYESVVLNGVLARSIAAHAAMARRVAQADASTLR